MFKIDYILFTFGGNGVSLIELLAVIAGLTCVVLAGRNNKYNFWAGYIYNILLFSLFLQKNLYSAMLLQPVAFGINAYGHWRWTHPRPGEESHSKKNELKVSMLTWKERGIGAVVVLILSFLWGMILSRLGRDWMPDIFKPDPSPYIDAFALMLTFSAQFVSALKKWDCWLIWLLVNIINIILYIGAGLVFMPVVSALFFLNGIWALLTWYRLYKKENP